MIPNGPENGVFQMISKPLMGHPESKKKKAATPTPNLRGRFDRFLRRWQSFRGYPPLLAILLVFFVYLAVKSFGVDDNPAQLKFVESSSDHASDPTLPDAQHLKPVFSGEAYDTAQRLRECGALLMAVFLTAFDEFQTRGRFPPNVHQILQDLQKRSLLPPGIEMKDGVLRSSLGELKLNYRAEPFSFEIVSFPTNGVQGPAILFRFPLPPSEANSITYFQYSSGKTPLIPDPFVAPEQLAAIGWNIRHWRGESLPLDNSALRDLKEQLHTGGR